jgi:hypothetical protein
MKADWMITCPRSGTAEELRAFIATYETLAETDAGAAAELRSARSYLRWAKADEAKASDTKAA